VIDLRAALADARLYLCTDSRRAQRGPGLARALLAESFARSRERGATVSELSTDSRTGALGRYEKIGTMVTSVWVNRAIDL
jgi:ribosomal protein S18 acetylase RimI-like enzyme